MQNHDFFWMKKVLRIKEQSFVIDLFFKDNCL